MKGAIIYLQSLIQEFNQTAENKIIDLSIPKMYEKQITNLQSGLDSGFTFAVEPSDIFGNNKKERYKKMEVLLAICKNQADRLQKDILSLETDDSGFDNLRSQGASLIKANRQQEKEMLKTYTYLQNVISQLNQICMNPWCPVPLNEIKETLKSEPKIDQAIEPNIINIRVSF